MTIISNKILSTGVTVHNLKNLTSNDLEEAQNIFDNGEFTENLDAESAYNERVENNFVGTYEIVIDGYSDYRRFKNMLPILSGEHPTIEEWRTNRIVRNGQEIKLSKWLNKEGVSKEVMDFYSQQIKTDKETWFFTISDMAQHVAGMTAYSSVFTSCMSPDREESIALSGALHDDKLLIGMLHKDIEDIKDMDTHLEARVCMRIVHIQGVQHLIPSIYYGSVETKNIMSRCIFKLGELHIHTRSIRSEYGRESVEIVEEANGCYELPMCDDVHVCETIDTNVNVVCPMCSGTKKYELYSSRINKHIEVECMMCNGSGVFSVPVYHEVNEYKEVEDLSEITTDADDYDHLGDRIVIGLDKERLEIHCDMFVD